MEWSKFLLRRRKWDACSVLWGTIGTAAGIEEDEVAPHNYDYDPVRGGWVRQPIIPVAHWRRRLPI